MSSAWHKFWFTQVDARQYAALRIVFGCLSALYLAELIPYVEYQFSRTGWLGSIRQIAAQNGGSWSLYFINVQQYAETFAYLIIGAGILSSLSMAIGWHSRKAACLTWLIWVSIWNRNPLLLDGDDAVLKIMCFYLMLSPCGHSWSVDTLRKHLPQSVAIWPLRLIQFQIALIYFISGWVKFHSTAWLDGSIMQYILIHPHYSRWDGWTAIHEPMVKTILSGLAWLIRSWELLFPILLLNVCARRISIAIGLVFHTGLLLTMNLRWFAIIMISLYLALIPINSLIAWSMGLINSVRTLKFRRN